VVSIAEQEGRAALRYRPRGARTLAVLTVDLAIPTTGPLMDVRALDDPLVRSLLAAGQARPGPHGLGFATAPVGAVLGPLEDRLWTSAGSGGETSGKPPPSRRFASRPAPSATCSPRDSGRQVPDEAPDQGGAERIEGERSQQRHQRDVQHGRAIV
jgi:hypothetical protein